MLADIPGLGVVFDPIWIIWLMTFGVVELFALALRKYWPNRVHNAGGTLSEFVWRLEARFVVVRFFVAGLLIWLFNHFIFGG